MENNHDYWGWADRHLATAPEPDPTHDPTDRFCDCWDCRDMRAEAAQIQRAELMADPT